MGAGSMMYLATGFFLLKGMTMSNQSGMMDRMSRDERGATAVEYGLLAVVAVLVAALGIEAFGDALALILPSQAELDTWDD